MRFLHLLSLFRNEYLIDIKMEWSPGVVYQRFTRTWPVSHLSYANELARNDGPFPRNGEEKRSPARTASDWPAPASGFIFDSIG